MRLSHFRFASNLPQPHQAEGSCILLVSVFQGFLPRRYVISFIYFFSDDDDEDFLKFDPRPVLCCAAPSERRSGPGLIGTGSRGG